MNNDDFTNQITKKDTPDETRKEEGVKKLQDKLNDEEDNDLIYQQILIMLNDINNSIR